MTAVEEPPLPTAGPWALAPSLRLAVVGHAGLAARLGRVVPTRTVGPRDDMREACRETDALLIELSAFEDPIGPWAHALRPIGFDRGGSLAQLLRVARLFERPVLAVDDRRADDRDGWQEVLGASIDDVAPLGPVIDGAPTWNPGLHVAASALAVASVDGDGGVVRPEGGEEWAALQRRAALAGAAVLDPVDPWHLHLAAELTTLGVAVIDDTGEELSSLAGRPDPAEALRLLGERLGLPVPTAADPLVIADGTIDGVDHELATHADLDLLAASATDRPVAVVSPDATATADEVAAVLRALDRARDADAVALDGGRVAAVRSRALRTLGPVDDGLHARVLQLAGRREVTR